MGQNEGILQEGEQNYLAANMCYPLRGENDPKGDTEMSRSASPTVGPK